MTKPNKGFTLAEVLLTLTVIGIVAAMTIPAVLNSTNKLELVVGLKKGFSTLTDATKLLSANAGCSDLKCTGIFEEPSSETESERMLNIWNKFKKGFNITKDCGVTYSADCWPDVTYQCLEGGDCWNIGKGITGGKAILADGSLIMFENYGTQGCTHDGTNGAHGGGPLDGAVCGLIYMDINGRKGPNKVGRDLFMFYIASTGVYPFGSHNDFYAQMPPEYGCSTIPDNDTNYHGASCAARVFKENAMNY